MRILFVLPTLSAGGAEGFIVSLSMSLANAGCESHVFVMGGVRDQRGAELLQSLSRSGVGVTGRESRSVRSVSNGLRIRQAVRCVRPDIVYVNLRAAEWFCMAALPAGFLGRPILARRLANRVPQDTLLQRIGFRVRSIFYRFTVACAEPVKVSAVECIGGSNGCNGDAIAVIRNGVSFPRAIPDENARRHARAALALEEDTFFILNVGRFDRPMRGGYGIEGGGGQKGQDVAIKAFAHAFGPGDDAVLGFLGDGPTIMNAKSLASDIGVDKNIRFFGKAPHPWQHLAAADAFIFPSRFEGMPNALVEAAGMGVPAIVSDIPEIRAIQPARGWLFCETGNHVAFANGLCELKQSLKSASEVARGVAIDFRQDFSMDRCVSQHLEFFRSVTSKAG